MLDRYRWIAPALAAVAAPMLVISLLAALVPARHRRRAARRWRGLSIARLDLRCLVRRWRSPSTCSSSSRASAATGTISTSTSAAASSSSCSPACRRSSPTRSRPACRCSRPSPAGRWSCPGSSKRAARRSCCCRRWRCRMRSRSSTSSARARCCGAACSTRWRGARSRSWSLLPLAVLVFSLLSERDRRWPTSSWSSRGSTSISLGLAAIGFRYRDRGAALARQAVLPRGVRRARDPRLAGQPRAVRDRSGASWSRWCSRRSTTRCSRNRWRCWPVKTPRSKWYRCCAADVAAAAPRRRLATLLRWSDEPLEVFLDDERSPAARLPAERSPWLAASGVSLLVPIFPGPARLRSRGQRKASSGEAGVRLLVGIVVLGAKRSEEPYTAGRSTAARAASRRR